MANINRRRFVELAGGLASLFVVAKSGIAAQVTNDRSVPLDSSKTEVEYGFRHRNGLILFFEYDSYGSQFGDSNPYFFPGQIDVNTATNG